jgi:hypothetical protein
MGNIMSSSNDKPVPVEYGKTIELFHIGIILCFFDK